MFNVQRLKINWTEFKNFISSLPAHLTDVKNSLLNRLEQIKLKIDAIDCIFASAKEARYAFQEATVKMKDEINAVIQKLQAA